MSSAGWKTKVAVIGGGPAGAAVAATLRRSGIEVTVVDAAARFACPGRERPRAGDGFRVGEAAPPGTERTISDLFGPDQPGFDPARHLPNYANQAAWGGADLTTTDFMLNPFGHGWHLDRAAFDGGLLDAAQRAGARVLTGWRLRSGDRQGGEWRLRLEPAAESLQDESERILGARFVCDASGRGADFARAHGPQLITDDRLVAVVGVLCGGNGDPDHTTLIEAVKCGWWYTAPVPGGRRVVAMFTDGDLLDAGQARTPAGLMERLEATRHVRAAVGDHGGELERAPLLRAAGTSRLDRPAGNGWIAAGDAAAALDPLSSQGILSALVMGQRAGAAIADCLSTGDGEAAIETYVSDYHRLFDRYRTEQRAAYGMERRWPASPFWRRRQG